MSDESQSTHSVHSELSELAHPVAQELRRHHVRAETGRLSDLAGLLLVFPIGYLSLVGLGAVLSADLRLPWIVIAPLAMALPGLRLLLRWLSARKHRVATISALVAIDDELQLSDRLSTAYEFASEEQPDGFQLAAIRDAQRRIEDARDARPSEPLTARPTTGMLWAGLAVGALCLWLANCITPVASLSPALAKNPEQVTAISQGQDEPPSNESKPPEIDPKTPEQRTARAVMPGDASSVAGQDEIPSDASRQGKNPMGTGRSAEARTAASGGSERGQPSNQAQSTKGQQSSKPKPKKKPPSKKDDEDRRDEEIKPPKESGSTMGRGSGKGSSKSPTASPWSAKDQVVSDEEQEPEEDEEVDDENDESKARGGVQPNLRQRKPPVNRDLQISMGSSQPSDDANGRGGPGGPKKQRGVAQLVLGVTFPDHVSAQPNPGVSKITQERIEPQAQQSDSISAEARGERTAPMGHLSRRVLSPWMQDLVRSFYLGLRKEGGPQ